MIRERTWWLWIVVPVEVRIIERRQRKMPSKFYDSDG